MKAFGSFVGHMSWKAEIGINYLKDDLILSDCLVGQCTAPTDAKLET